MEMNADPFGALTDAMADEEGWRLRGRQGRAAYQAAQPWPHLVLHDLLPEDLVLLAESEELPMARALGTHKSHQEVKSESSTVAGPAATALLDAMCTPAFVAMVEEVTGLDDLVPDPTHVLSGLHVSGPGSFQSIHRDFVRHPVTSLWHRVNVLVYLNSSWSEDFGGQLELWPLDMSACGQQIPPEAGTVVIFETRHETLHGVPDPLTCPAGRARLSLASYYYSVERPAGKVRDPIIRHPRRPQDPWGVGIARPGHIALGLIQPIYDHLPIVRRALNRYRQGV
jgi:Rps23 Pro-64 3,4-dihydroxylase Tpa1-like proline 4-hydroxylase